MKTQNKVQLIGYVGNEPQVKLLFNGSKMTTLRVATNHFTKTSEGETIKSTAWHQVVAWDTKADLAQQNFCQGSHILIEGYLAYRNFVDSTGITRQVTEIHALHFLNLDR